MKNTQGILVPLLIIVIVSLIGIRELFLPGFFDTHDGFTHIMRLAHFNEALRDGQFPVRWLPTWMAGYGSPVFILNYNLPYYVGSLLHSLGFSYQSSIKGVFGIGYILSGIFSLLFLKKLLKNDLAALVGSTLYLWAPYQFTDIFIRGALGETTSFLFFPILFYLITCAYNSKQKTFPLWTSVVWMLFILNHNIMSLIGAGLYFIYAFYLQLRLKANLKFFINSIYVFVLGLGLAAFFWIPAILENKFTNISNAYHFDNGYPSLKSIIYSKWQYHFAVPSNQENSMSFQLGLVHIVIPIVFIFLLVINKSKIRSKPTNHLISLGIFLLIIFMASIYFITKASSSIYEVFSFLKFIIFPWRFLEIATFAVAALVSIIVVIIKKFQLMFSFVIIVLSLFLYWPYSKVITTRFSFTDVDYITMIKTNSGLFPETEFGPPRQSYYQLLKLIENRGPAWTHPFFEDDSLSSSITNIRKDNLLYSANITSFQTAQIRANTFYFPGWKLYIDNKETPLSKDKHGLINFYIEKGTHNIKLIFKNTPIRNIGNSISIASLIVLMILLILRLRPNF
ncbi:hypothetical protein HYU92_03155 [Candidatus Curtissbacteria bacterium]|nr:hypothetical protein [Candidatus Curtissbacteria bacterium]